MEQARRLIAENLRTQNPYLDLGNCGLTDLRELPELFECTHLEELVLSNFWYEFENETWVTKVSQNQGVNNEISFLAPLFYRLSSLKKIILSSNQISDIVILKVLKQLRSLDLSSNEIIDIAVLKELKQLTFLNLSSNQISNIAVLKELKQLTFLNLSSNQISDIVILKELKQLRSLDLSFNGIIDITVLKELKQLTSLDLSGNEIIDIAALKELKQLTSLDLSFNGIIDITVLKELKQLTSLNLSGSGIIDIAALKELKQLTSLDLSSNEIIDISSIKELKQLASLYLNENEIIDISSIKELKQLTSLDLSSNEIIDIAILKELKQLTDLILSSNEIIDIAALKELKQLTDLDLRSNQIQYIPKEVYEQGNCVKDLYDYWQEIEKRGSDINNQLKIMFLGNGCVGKTTLLHWFIDNEFKDIPQNNRTEGIIIKSLPLFDEKIIANFWDFGGQEVYHATHRLFLGKRTLYILVWATETSEKESEERHSPQYWLDMIADIQDTHERSMVLIVQNLIENQVNKNVLSDEDLEDYNKRGLYIQTLTLNAKTGKNIKTFKAQVEEAIEDILANNKEKLPNSWIEIRKKVAEIKKDKEKTLDWTDFLTICEVCKLAGSPNVVIDYLHRAGEVFYYENQFDNKIILDQMWALDKVYTVLKAKHIERYKGVFSLDDLIAIWQQQDSNLRVEEHKIFLNFMLKNQLMFYTEGYESGERKEEFVIPQLLPKDKPILLKTWERIPEKLQYRIEYAFLHRDIIERFIVSTAHLSKDKEYWRNGLYINYEDNDAVIEVIENESKKKVISIQCVGNQKDALLQKIREEFNKIRPLEKAKEYVCVNNSWELVSDKLQIIDREKSGFPNREELSIENLFENKNKVQMRTIKIFLASSAELKADRDELRLFFSVENDRYVEKGIYFKLVQWEYFLDAVSDTRMQNEYNKALKDCDVVLSLFYTRAGKYTQEEFETALSSFKATGSPKIYTYFKDAPINMGDIDDKVLSLLAFKKRLEELEHFPTHYTDINDLKVQIKRQIEYILEM
jgi:Leucine-rich repeat (LRR) protein